MPDCRASFKKPVSQITDRAKRYRANRCKKKAKFCETCGSKKFLVIGHRDGNESNGADYNLGTFCKSCNTIDGKAAAKAGRGVRTRQYNPKKKRRNPGASNLAQYVQAAVEHSRGSHDAGGKVIHETPKPKRREFAREIAFRKGYRKNPAVESPADRGYRKFHGRGPDEHYILDVNEQDPYGNHPELFQCGQLVRFIIGENIVLSGEDGDDIEAELDNWWTEEINFVPSVEAYHNKLNGRLGESQAGINQVRKWLREIGCPDVAGVPLPEGQSKSDLAHQLYIVGGNQDIDELLPRLGSDPTKELHDLGFCYLIEYFTQKRFDGYDPINYWHHFGEKGGQKPRLTYNSKYKELRLFGGSYTVRAAGIEN